MSKYTLKPLIYLKYQLYKHPVLIVIGVRLVVWGTVVLIISLLLAGNNSHLHKVR